MQHENGDAFVEIKPIPTPNATNVLSSTSLPSPAAALSSPTPKATLQPIYPPAATPAPAQDGNAFFTLSILNDTISVAYGVEESTLKKTPGWLTTSVLPGESGMCVVYATATGIILKCWKRWSAAIRSWLRWMALPTPTPFRTSQFTKVPTICGFLLWMAKRLCW